MDDYIPDFSSTPSAENSDNEDNNAKEYSSESEKFVVPTNGSKVKKKTSKSKSTAKKRSSRNSYGSSAIHKNNVQFSCDHCDMKFYSKKLLKMHKKEGDKGLYKCDICDLMSCKETDLTSHTKREHSKNNVEKNTDEENSNDETSKYEHENYVLENEIGKAHDSKKANHPISDKGPSKNLKSSTNRRLLKKRNCELCGHIFSSKYQGYWRERITHLLNKHFKERFKNEVDLPQSKPFTCPWEGCNVSTDRSGLLSFHYFHKHGYLEKYLREEKNKTQTSNSSKVSKTAASSFSNEKSEMKNTKKTCELCGHEYKSRTYSIDKVRHLINKHFKEKFHREITLPKVYPFACPFEYCSYQSNQGRYPLECHYFTQHGIMEKYLNEEINSNTSSPSKNENFKEIPTSTTNDEGEEKQVDVINKKLENVESRKNSKCVLCEYEFTTTNRGQEKLSHLYRKHFRERFDHEIKLPRSSPFVCPFRNECKYQSGKKSKDNLVFHCLTKHGIMEKYLNEMMKSSKENIEDETSLQNPNQVILDIHQKSSENSENNTAKLPTLNNDDICSDQNSDNGPDDDKSSNKYDTTKQFSSESAEDSPYKTSKKLKKKISSHPTKQSSKCELCGLDFQKHGRKDHQAFNHHLFHKHFKEKFYSEYDLPHSPPFTCPFPRCEKKHKVRSKLAIHYAVTHKVLKRYLEEEINLANQTETDVLPENSNQKNNAKQFLSESEDDSSKSSNQLKKKIDDFDEKSISSVPKKKKPRPKPKSKQVNPRTTEEKSEFEKSTHKPKRSRLISRDDDSGIFNDNSSVISATKRENFGLTNDVTVGSDFEYSRGDENIISDDTIENNIGISENLGLVVHKNPQTSLINENNEIIHKGTNIKREKQSSTTSQIFVCPICELEGIYRNLDKAHQHITEFHQLPLEKQIALGVVPQARTLF